MRQAPKRGLRGRDVQDRTRALGVEVSIVQVREALRRMRQSEEVRCQNRQWWIPTDKLRGDAAKENEAPNGEAAGASEAGEAATSPIENRQGFRLIG